MKKTHPTPTPRLLRRERKPAKPKTFLGLEIDRKTNVLSFVAFILSVGGIAGQVYFFLQGPRVKLQSPAQVTFFASTLSSDDATNYLKMTSQMAYVNTGQPGFNDAISKEYAVLEMGGKRYRHFWKSFVSSGRTPQGFAEGRKGDAVPVPVNAGSVESHETSFTPEPVTQRGRNYAENYLEWAQFQQAIGREQHVIVSIYFETFGGNKGHASCKVLVNEALTLALKRGWAAPRCG